MTVILLFHPPSGDEIFGLPLSACHTEAEINQVAAAVRAFFGR